MEGYQSQPHSVLQGGPPGSLNVLPHGSPGPYTVLQGGPPGSLNVLPHGSPDPYTVLQGGLPDPLNVLPHGSPDPYAVLQGGLPDPLNVLPHGSPDPYAVLQGGLPDPLNVLPHGSPDPSTVLQGGLPAPLNVLPHGSPDPSTVLQGGLPGPLDFVPHVVPDACSVVQDGPLGSQNVLLGGQTNPLPVMQGVPLGSQNVLLEGQPDPLPVLQGGPLGSQNVLLGGQPNPMPVLQSGPLGSQDVLLGDQPNPLPVLQGGPLGSQNVLPHVPFGSCSFVQDEAPGSANLLPHDLFAELQGGPLGSHSVLPHSPPGPVHTMLPVGPPGPSNVLPLAPQDAWPVLESRPCGSHNVMPHAAHDPLFVLQSPADSHAPVDPLPVWEGGLPGSHIVLPHAPVGPLPVWHGGLPGPHDVLPPLPVWEAGAPDSHNVLPHAPGDPLPVWEGGLPGSHNVLPHAPVDPLPVWEGGLPGSHNVLPHAPVDPLPVWEGGLPGSHNVLPHGIIDPLPVLKVEGCFPFQQPSLAPQQVEQAMPQPFAQASEPVFLRSYLEDSAMMVCVPNASSQPSVIPANIQTSQAAVVETRIASVSQASSSKAVSVVRSSDGAALCVKPALVRTDTGLVLSANVDQVGKIAHWDWQRATAAIGLQTLKVGKYLRDNTELHKTEMMEAELCIDQIAYQGWGSQVKGQHSLQSQAFVLVILLINLTKQHSAAIKTAALKLVIGLLKAALVTMADIEGSLAGIIYGKDKKYHQQILSFGTTGIVENLNALMLQDPACNWAWNHLMEKGYCNLKITSAFAFPTLWDFLIFITWAKCNPGTKKVWFNFGQLIWPKLIWAIGTVLDKFAFFNSQKALEELPLLKTKKGKRKLVPWINKLILLRKMKRVKNHRKNAATSHDDLVPSNSQIVKAEEILVASLYARKLREAYQDCFHFCIHWDPSNYDVETMVSILYSHQIGVDGLASYLPIQNMRPVQKTEVDPEILALSSMNRLTRVQGFNEIRAVSHSLKAVGMPLEKFAIAKEVLWKSLEGHEERIWDNGVCFIKNTRTGEKKPQLPENFSIHRTPILVSISDQGGINRAGLDYLVFKMGLGLHVLFDPYHRVWNDVRDCLKKGGDLWKSFLSFALLWNVNYGPFGSKEWYQKKVARAKDIVASNSAHCEPFLSFLPLICKERQIPEPSSPEGREEIFNSILQMKSIRSLGPIVKLMRWFSWFQSEHFFAGENWVTKYIMLDKGHHLDQSSSCVEASCNFVKEDNSTTLKTNLSHKQELAQLKYKHGTYGLAPLLVTPATMYQKDLIKLIVNPCWCHHAWQSENIKTPQQNVMLIIGKTQGGWLNEPYDLVIKAFLTPAVLKELYPPLATSEATKKNRISLHYSFATKLIGKRCMSLMAQYLRPPLLYAALLSPEAALALDTQKAMQKHWLQILKLERNDAKGVAVPALDFIHCLQGAVCRLAYIVNEMDTINSTNHCKAILKALCVNLGDTSCIENTHQSAKDTLRQSRHNQRSRVHKFKACLDAKILQVRKANHLVVHEMEVVQQSLRTLEPFVPLTHPSSHKMNKSFQDLMQWKSSTHYWPSTSAVSQFEEAMAFENLVRQENDNGLQDFSCLCGDAGDVVSCLSESLVIMVLAKSGTGFLGWVLEVVSQCIPGESTDTEQLLLRPSPTKFGFVNRQITSLEDWLHIPVEPTLEGDHAALVLKQVGEPVPLLKAKLMSGLDLTVNQVKLVLKSLGIFLKGAPSKAECYSALANAVAGNAEEATKFLNQSALKKPSEEEQEDLQEYSDLLDLMEEDLENRNDPDIKGEKKKLAQKKSLNQWMPMVNKLLLNPLQKEAGAGAGARAGAGVVPKLKHSLKMQPRPKQSLRVQAS